MWKYILFATFGVSSLNYLGSLLSIWTFLQIVAEDSPTYYAFAISGYIAALCLLIVIMAKCFACWFFRALYYIVAMWWACLLYLFFTSIVYLIIRAGTNVPVAAGLCIQLVPAVILAAIGHLNTFCLNVRTQSIVIRGLRNAVRLVHLSDVHLGPIYGKEHVGKIVSEVSKLNPDVVVITGDLFDGSVPADGKVLEPFGGLTADVLFVQGNHDQMFVGEEELMAAFKDTKIIWVRDQQFAHKSGLNFIGFDYSRECGYVEKRLRMEDIQSSSVNVLLYHVPTMKAEELEHYNVALHLTGHTHAGQFLPVCSAMSCVYPYLRGLHRSESGRAYVNVSDGVGTAGPPLRMFSSCTIDLLNLHS